MNSQFNTKFIWKINLDNYCPNYYTYLYIYVGWTSIYVVLLCNYNMPQDAGQRLAVGHDLSQNMFFTRRVVKTDIKTYF